MSYRPRKRFGQHFLHDQGVLTRLLGAIDPRPDDPLVEIGPGRGVLTAALLSHCRRVDAVELDRDLVPELEARFAASAQHGGGRLRVHQADALAFDFCALADAGRRLRIVGNLPYNISTPLLFHLLDGIDCIRDMHFMLQREVVERMAAGPGSKTYGRLSLMVQARCAVESLFRVPAQAFRPPPKVESAVVRLLPHRQPPFDPALGERFDALVRLAFGQRRKTLRNSLRPLLSADAIRTAGIDPAARPEALSLRHFARLAEECPCIPTNTSW